MRIFIFVFSLVVTLTSAIAQERQWTLDASEKEAFLVFGVAQTDDVGLSFWCEIGKPKISIFANVPHAHVKKDGRIHIELKIDDDVFKIIAMSSTAAKSGDVSVEAPVAIDGTVMKAMSKAERISITALDHTNNFPLVDADINGLLRVCSGDFSN